MPRRNSPTTRAEASVTERSVLAGIMLYGAEAMTQVPDLSANDFLSGAARKVFVAAAKVEAEGIRIDAASVLSEVGERHRDVADLVSSLEDPPVLHQLPLYAARMKEERAFEAALRTAEKIQAMRTSDRATKEKLVDIQRLAQDLLGGTSTTAPLIEFQEVVQQEIDFLTRVDERQEIPERLETGLLDLDRKLYVEPGDVLVVAGDTGSGKSSLVGQIAGYQAKLKQTPVVFVTSEMTHRQMLIRVTAGLSGLSVARLVNPRTALEENAREVHGMYSWLPIYFQRHFPPRVEHMNSAIRTGVAKGARLAIVDYAQRLADLDEESHERAVGRIAEDAKNLALELRIPVVMAAQINRQAAQRNDPRPKLSDLRASGRIEQEANAVVFTYNPKKYGKSGPTELIVAKQRNGPTGPVKVYFDEESCVFRLLEA